MSTTSPSTRGFRREPAIDSSVYGRGIHEKNGDLHTIEAQSSESKSLTFVIHDGAEALDGLVRSRDTLLAGNT